MRKALLLASSMVLLAHGAAFGQWVDLEGRYWRASLAASAKLSGDSIEGTDIDFEDDLRLDVGNLPELRFTIFPGPNHKVWARYVPLSFDERTTLERTLEIEGTTFPAGSTVEAELDIHYIRLGWAWQFINVLDVFKLGPLLDFKGFIFQAALETRGLERDVRESIWFPIFLPTAGLALDITPHPTVHLFAEASGLPFGELGHLVDAEVGLRVLPIPYLTLSAGYRVFQVRVQNEDDFGQIRLHGPFAALSLRF